MAKTQVPKTTRRLDGVAVQVNQLHGEFLAAARKTLNLGIKIGGLLELKKESLGHGAWLPWCQRYLAFDARSAQNYMKLWRNRALLKSENVSDLSAAYRLLRETKSERMLPAPDQVPPLAEVRHGVASWLRKLADRIDTK